MSGAPEKPDIRIERDRECSLCGKRGAVVMCVPDDYYDWAASLCEECLRRGLAEVRGEVTA